MVTAAYFPRQRVRSIRTLTFFEGTIVIGGTRIPALDLSPPTAAPRARPASARQLCLPGMLDDGGLFAVAP